jgi:hypothetical protein
LITPKGTAELAWDDKFGMSYVTTNIDMTMSVVVQW